MENEFETVIEDGDRKIEFDVVIKWEKWSEFGRPVVGATSVKITGARVAFPGMLSGGARSVVWCELSADDVATICVAEFCREFRADIDDAVLCEFERIHDSELCLV